MTRGQQKTNKTNDGSEHLNSSQGSDDAAMTAAIIKQMQSKADKTRKANEAKLDKALERDIENALNTRKQKFVDSTEKMAALYGAFQTDYARIEDKIRAKWVEVAELVSTRLTEAEMMAVLDTEGEAACAEGQKQGLHLKLAAVQSLTRQIRGLSDKLQE